MRNFPKSSTWVPSLLLLLCFGCKWDINDPVSWDVDILAPIAQSTIGLADAVQDSSLLTEDSSQTVVLVLRDTLINLGLEDILTIPDTTYIQRFNLAEFRLGDQSFAQNITLGAIARGLSEQGNIIGGIILFNHGNTLPSLPAAPGLSSGAVSIDASSLFEEAFLVQGEVEITLTNQLPIDLNNVSFEVRNRVEGNVLFSGFISSLPSGASDIRTFDIAGQQIESDMEANLLNLDVPESTNVPIDTTDFIEFSFTARNLQAREATAIFPSQTVDSSSLPFEYTFTGENVGVQIQKATIQSGVIEAEVISTLGDTVEVIYRLSSANLNGVIPEIVARLNPAAADENFLFTEEIDLAGYELDFTQGGTTFNTLAQYYQINLIYSGNLVSIDQEDSVLLNIKLKDIQPDYLEGYFGNGNLDFSGSQAFSSLENIQVDHLDLINPRARLIFENSLGIDLEGTVRSLSAQNSNTPVATPLSSTLFASPLGIIGPELPDTQSVVTSTFTFTPQNSNIPELIRLLPNQLSYDVGVEYNANSSGLGNPINFATRNGKLRGIVEFELPLEGSLSGLVFTDTSSLDFSLSEDSTNLNSGILSLQFDNGFPLEVEVLAAILDENFNFIEWLSEGEKIAPGIVDNTGTVIESAFSEIAKDLSKSQLQRIIESGKYLAFNYRVSSQPSNSPVKMKSDYRIKASLVGNFSYQLNP